MKLGLQLKLKTTLAPQLIQSLKMLQMPLLKLEQTIRHELATNPMLEEMEELEAEAPESEFDVVEEEKEDAGDIDTDLYERLDEDEGYKVREPKEQIEERFEGTAAQVVNLYTHLLEQLSLLKVSQREVDLGEYIIGNIAPDGYLTVSVAEMAAELECEADELQAMLDQIQKFDPPGVGARDLRESLMIQLREKDMEGTLAFRIVDEHLNDLHRKSILQVAKLMGVPVERAQNALNVIKSLSPTPAQGRFDSGASPIVPDLIVERFGEEYEVFHNDAYVPRLRINSGYRSLIKRGNSTNKETKTYVRQKLEQARWLLNAINQRRSTMIRVMHAIIKRQSGFFEHGPAFLKPLIMEEIAQEVDMNVATISRVSSGKYVQTPFGVHEIKYFFNSGIAREDGGEMSKRAVKQRIEELIKGEPGEKPYSDQEIYRRLNAEGIKLARRTVTKYREELKLPPARLRKRVVS